MRFNPSLPGPMMKAAEQKKAHRETREREETGAEKKTVGSARCFTEVGLHFNPSPKGPGLGCRRRRGADGVKHLQTEAQRDPRSLASDGHEKQEELTTHQSIDRSC